MSINPYSPPKSDLGREEYGPDGRTCPNCLADVSFWRMYVAIGPQHIRCKRCGTRVGFDDLGALGAVWGLVLVLSGVGSWFVAAWLPPPRFVMWALLFSLSAAALTAPVLAQCRARRRLRVFH
jgi:hypothetical protein